ncbi:LysR family transcriptional regulator [Streptomyces sp. NPDC002766]
MEYAVAVADELGFTRAAARCSIGQSGLSHQITQLEREVGARLFDRMSRSVRLPPAGQTFVHGARQALRTVQEMNAAIAAIDGQVQGWLSIGVITPGGRHRRPGPAAAVPGVVSHGRVPCPATEA